MTGTATLMINGRKQFFYADGSPLAGGYIYYYIPGTTTFKTTWQDSGQVNQNTNPIILDAAGTALVYGNGIYREYVTDENSNLIQDALTNDFEPSTMTLTGIVFNNGSNVTASDTVVTGIGKLQTQVQQFQSIAALRLFSGTPPASFEVLGYYTAGGVGGGVFSYVPGDTTSADNGGTIIVDASGHRYYRQQISDLLNVESFGAKGDGSTDDTAAIQAAINSGALGIVFRGTTYVISAALTIAANDQKLIGAGYGATVIKVNSTTANGIVVNGWSNICIQDLSVIRVGTPVSGANGIYVPDCSATMIQRVMTFGHWVGTYLGGTDYSTYRDSYSENNLSHGVFLTNTATVGSLQWQLINILSTNNVGSGFYTSATNGPGQVTMGNWIGCATFANTGTGASFSDVSSCPIYGIRLFECYFGSDGNDEIAIATHGGQNLIRNCFLELAGGGPTGPTNSTPASNVGNGISTTSTVSDVSIVGCHINGMSDNGITLQDTASHISGCRITNNGVAGTGGAQNGIVNSAGRVSITGCHIGNVLSSTYQQYGVYAADATQVSIVGGDLTGNTTAATGASSNPLDFLIMGVLPQTINTIIPNGAMCLGSNLTPQSAATLNVGGGLYKGGSAYTFP